MSDDDEWVKVAMVVDSLVAELLTNLKEIKSPPPPPPPYTSAPQEQTLTFDWKMRQRRSKAGVVNPKIKQTSTASPNTPLSWSGATSISGGGGQGGGGSGCAASIRGLEVEESSQLSTPPSAPKTSEMERSKVSGSCEVSTTKKYRKKKTLSELKEEELSLERERRQLKRELESIRDNLVRERTRNANFKRMKQQLASFKPISMTLPSATIHQLSQNGCHDRKIEIGAGKFQLPDLNLPLEENPCGLL